MGQRQACELGSYYFKNGPNNRMQLTWLTGAPIHGGLGSPVRLRAARPRFIRHAADASR